MLYTGLTRRAVDERVTKHQQGLSDFTRSRRPVELIFCEHYPVITDAIAAERRIKGWTRAKKLAAIAGDFAGGFGAGAAARVDRGSRAPGSRRRCAAPHHEERGIGRG